MLRGFWYGLKRFEIDKLLCNLKRSNAYSTRTQGLLFKMYFATLVSLLEASSSLSLPPVACSPTQLSSLQYYLDTFLDSRGLRIRTLRCGGRFGAFTGCIQSRVGVIKNHIFKPFFLSLKRRRLLNSMCVRLFCLKLCDSFI